MKKLNLLFIVFSIFLSPYFFTGCTGARNSVSITFEEGEYTVSDEDKIKLLNRLSKTKKYLIQGYFCKEDKGSNEEQFAAANRRAETVGKILIDHGFPAKNITTVVYDESSKCKAVVVETDDSSE